MEKARNQGIIARVLAGEALGTMDYLVGKEAQRLSKEISRELRKQA
jgi:hypothetical protein